MHWPHHLLLLILLGAAWHINRRTGLLPDRLSFPGMLLGILSAAIFPSALGAGSRIAAAGLSFVGALAGFFSAMLMAILAKRAFGNKYHSHPIAVK